MTAVKAGDVDTITSLFESGVEFGYNPLHEASESGQTDVVSLLLDHIHAEDSVSVELYILL